ncbi:MAG: YceI family protein [Chitinophagaceae bacterium]|nr:YceI family protein [Chitinophagaceae bacterium]
MKKTLLILSLVMATGNLFAQKKITTSATVKFDASTPIDDLPKAENKTVIASLNTSTGAVAFEAAVKNFAFTNPMIQDHFNGEKWMNSDKHPTFTYKGNITNLSAVNFAKDGAYKVNTEGVLTVRGVEQKIATPVTIVVKEGAITAATNFSIKLADFGITGAPIDGGKIAKEPKISVSAELK